MTGPSTTEPMKSVGEYSRLSTSELLTAWKDLETRSVASKADSTARSKWHVRAQFIYSLLAFIVVFSLSMAHNKAMRAIDKNTAVNKEVVAAAKAKAEFDDEAVKKLGVAVKLPPVALRKHDDIFRHLNNAEKLSK